MITITSLLFIDRDQRILHAATSFQPYKMRYFRILQFSIRERNPNSLKNPVKNSVKSEIFPYRNFAEVVPSYHRQFILEHILYKNRKVDIIEWSYMDVKIRHQNKQYIIRLAETKIDCKHDNFCSRGINITLWSTLRLLGTYILI